MDAVRVLLRRTQQLSVVSALASKAVPVLHMLALDGNREYTLRGWKAEKLVQNSSYVESLHGVYMGFQEWERGMNT